jgi:uncharacterized membrane protein
MLLGIEGKAAGLLCSTSQFVTGTLFCQIVLNRDQDFVR